MKWQEKVAIIIIVIAIASPPLIIDVMNIVAAVRGR